MFIPCNNHVKTFTRENALEEDDKYSPAITEDPIGIKDGVYEFQYRYPLSSTARFRHELTNETNFIDILLLGQKDYTVIYETEEAVSGDPGHIQGMLNRATSAGPYGIWGHDFCDLYFEGVIINEEKMTVEFEVGS